MKIECIYIEQFIKPMKKAGKTRGGTASISIDLEKLEIIIQGQGLALERTAGTKGGYRYFFSCPTCGRRCRKLYRYAVAFACGQCQDIHRETLNRSKTDCTYYWELAVKECKKVDPNYTPKHSYYSHDNFPKRPKYMRLSKYLYHWRRFMTYMDQGDGFWMR